MTIMNIYNTFIQDIWSNTQQLFVCDGNHGWNFRHSKYWTDFSAKQKPTLEVCMSMAMMCAIVMIITAAKIDIVTESTLGKCYWHFHFVTWFSKFSFCCCNFCC